MAGKSRSPTSIIAIGNDQEQFNYDSDREQNLGDTERRVITKGDTDTLSLLPTHPRDDTITGNNDGNEIRGTNNDNTTSGTFLNDRIFGHDGDDTLNDAYGSDTIEGKDGGDTVQGAELDDHVYGDKGNDLLAGEFGNDYLSAGDGIDDLYEYLQIIQLLIVQYMLIGIIQSHFKKL